MYMNGTQLFVPVFFFFVVVDTCDTDKTWAGNKMPALMVQYSSYMRFIGPRSEKLAEEGGGRHGTAAIITLHNTYLEAEQKR